MVMMILDGKKYCANVYKVIAKGDDGHIINSWNVCCTEIQMDKEADSILKSPIVQIVEVYFIDINDAKKSLVRKSKKGSE